VRVEWVGGKRAKKDGFQSKKVVGTFEKAMGEKAGGNRPLKCTVEQR